MSLFTRNTQEFTKRGVLSILDRFLKEISLIQFVTDCTPQYTQSRSPPLACRPARAAAPPTTLRLPPPPADGYKGKAGEPKKASSPGAASRVTPERRTGRAARRCLSWWAVPQEGISSTLRLHG